MSDNAGVFFLQIDASDTGKRIDTVVASLVPGLSRSQAADLIKQGEIQVSGEPKKPGYRLRFGDDIIGRVPPPDPANFLPEPIFLDILHEDADLVIINKPPDLVMHPAPGHTSGTLVNGLLHHCPDLAGIGGRIRPGIVHRLDKDTTGVLAVAKNSVAQACLAAQFKNRTVRKQYMAVVYGVPASDSGVVENPIGRHPVDRKKMTIRPNGRPAITRWQVMERYDGMALLSLGIETGRTHQIRVHCAALGHPVAGDPVYGGRKPPANLTKIIADKAKGLDRQMLHAASLTFVHPQTQKCLTFSAPLPDDMERLIMFLRKTSTNTPSRGECQWRVHF